MTHISQKAWIFPMRPRANDYGVNPPGERVANAGRERRANPRYPLHMELNYRLMHRNLTLDHGPAQIENISSSGVLMVAGRTFPPGATVELIIQWPVLRDGLLALELQVTGRVVRSSDDGTAVRALSHDSCVFRLRKSDAFAPESEPGT